MEIAEELPTETHLSYPVASSSKDPTPPPVPQARQVLRDRLYVGNLAPTVDEYTLLQVFSKYGKIAKLDFLFHKAGPMRGKPRGYAFVEFSDESDAAKALASANDKLLRGRKLMVTYAQQAPVDSASSFQGRTKRHMSDIGKPTTLSLIKSLNSNRNNGTEDKIAKMEAKLRQMEQVSSSGRAMSGHSSLPAKPVGAAYAANMASMGPPRTSFKKSTPASLPSLPLTQPSASHSRLSSISAKAGTSSTAPLPRKPNALIGVKLKKHGGAT
ncbi:hypothetical protein PHLGIDRAFT_123390 [Phlebiopsis gigantea 11061_1 CR5-6]|uniref:Probable RNA-binding protein 18 n=1 Tax=Phlebiopsis gigantea (strain 11061_1 CR5-6) TaxID=745531 RepID=A0A0C3RYQ4_PHLG1|nr:hypothetical protein PHLGIDRAFT_123390 [Phlebiopsis gigantea 11061_1 CR5-6]